MSTSGKFYGIGLGPGDPGLVTLKAAETLRHVAVIFSVASRQSDRSVSGDIITVLKGISARRVELTFTMGLEWAERRQKIEDNAALIRAELDAGNDCAFVTIGDAMTYSTCGYLLNSLRQTRPQLEWEIIPGVNSWSALAAKSGTILTEDRETLEIVPSYAPDEAAELDRRLNKPAAIVLLKTYKSRDELVRRLSEHNRPFIYGANLGLDNEFVSGDADEIVGRDREYLSMLLIPPVRQEGT